MDNDIDKKLQLYYKQKETLDTFLAHGAITEAQYEFSLNGLITKMHLEDILKDKK